MASHILHLPFRRSRTVSLADAIKQYISSKYDQHPDMFTKDLEDMDALRSSAMHVTEPHPSGVHKLQAYAAQLVWIGGKFPVDMGVEFAWFPALGYNTQRPVVENNIRFELANVLFNLAAMYSQLATSTNRTTTAGLKQAYNYLCTAAGVLSHLRTNIVPNMRSNPPEDMATMTLESLEQLMLAQAQECFWQKAVKDGLKDPSISKLAAKVSDLYADASEWAVRSDAVSSEWIHHMTAKHHHFAAAAEYRAARHCLEKRKYGEEVARLRSSLACANEATKEARYITRAVLGDLTSLKNRVTEDLKRAEKDNDMIYLQPIPPKSDLKTLERAAMVAPKTPDEVSDPLALLAETSRLGRPLFSKLVPYSVHVATNIYADRRDRLVATTIAEFEGLTTHLHDVCTSLNLPGSLQALEKPLGLPPGLISHAEEIRQQEGLSRLYRSVDGINKLKDQDRAMYQEGVDLVRQEEMEDERSRRKYGTDQWDRPSSADAASQLYAQVDEIKGYLEFALNSDGVIQGKITDNKTHIQLLCGPAHDLEQFVPSSRRAIMTAAVEREVKALRSCLNEVSRLESRRKRKIEALKLKAERDNINPELLKEAARLEREYPMQTIEAVQFEKLFEKRLVKYDDDAAAIETERQEQQDIIDRLKHANAAFVSARRCDSSSRQREKALQQLENAYLAYKEIVSNLDAARKFYNDLAAICEKFREDCRIFSYARRAEATQLESDLALAMSALRLQQATVLQEQRQAERDKRPYPALAHAEQPAAITAPTPTRAPPVAGMWTPDMPIRFGTTPGRGGQSVQAATDARWDPSKGMKFG